MASKNSTKGQTSSGPDKIGKTGNAGSFDSGEGPQYSHLPGRSSYSSNMTRKSRRSNPSGSTSQKPHFDNLPNNPK